MKIQLIWVGALLTLAMTWSVPLPAFATVGWEVGDMVLDFGVTTEAGERTVLVDKTEAGTSFSVELIWKLNPDACFLRVQGDGITHDIVTDDGLFGGHPDHAEYAQIDTLSLNAKPGNICDIDPAKDEFVTVAREPQHVTKDNQPTQSAPIGAIVMIFRATAFFVPHDVTVKAGEKIVWIYADGAKEPHSVTSGACRLNDCSGGGNIFDSGRTLRKPGNRFEHVFTKPGTYPYHCDLHLSSMQGTVTVKP